jgi:hypothetical protein
MPDKCPKGKIERIAYDYIKKKTKKAVKISKTCVTDKGKPGKGPKIITIPEYDVGLLSNYGYSLKEKHELRQKAIKKSIKEHDPLKVLRHINALRTLQKSNEKIFKKLDKDMKWLQKHYNEVKKKD